MALHKAFHKTNQKAAFVLSESIYGDLAWVVALPCADLIVPEILLLLSGDTGKTAFCFGFHPLSNALGVLTIPLYFEREIFDYFPLFLTYLFRLILWRVGVCHLGVLIPLSWGTGNGFLPHTAPRINLFLPRSTDL